MATPTFACGGECQSLKHWSGTNGTPTFDTTVFEPGGGVASIKCVASASVVNFFRSRAAATVAVARFYIRWTTLPSVDTEIWVSEVITGQPARLWFRSATSDVIATFDKVTFGSASKVVTTGVWYLFDIKASVVANPSTLDWQVNGVAVGTQLTFAQAATTFGGASGNESYGSYATAFTGTWNIDQVLWSSTAADYPLGAGYVQGFSPTSDGTHTATGTDIVKGTTAVPVGAAITSATTDAWQWVDDVPVDATTDFWNQQTLATEYAEVKFNTVSVAPRSVEVIVTVSAASNVAETQKAVLWDGTTASDVYALVSAGVTWTTLVFNRKHYALTPTGGAWDVTKFNAAAVRWGFSTDATPDVYCNSIMLEAEFAPAASGLPPGHSTIETSRITAQGKNFAVFHDMTAFGSAIPPSLIGQDTFFGAAGETKTYDWPNPRGSVPGVALKTWTNSYLLGLIGQDKFFGGAGQGPSYDWPNPRGPTPSINLRTHLWNPLLTLLNVVVAVLPFSLLNWPNPFAAKRNPQDFADPSETWLLKDTFYGAAGQPPANLDWPVPRGATPNIGLRTWLANLLQNTLAPALTTYVLRGPLYTVFVPISSVVARAGWIGNNLLTTTLGVVGAAPFAWFGWPNPFVHTAKRNPQDFIKPTETKLIGQDQFFAGAGMGPTYSWPNPQAPRPASDLRTHIWNPLATLLTVIVQAPFAFYAWIVPKAKPNYDQGYVDPTEFWMLKDTFYGAPDQPPSHEWVNPRGPISSIDLRTWIVNLIQTTLAVVQTIPFVQLFWPNPTPPKPSITLLTQNDPTKLLLRGQDTMFGAPGEPAHYDWPNPIQPRRNVTLFGFVDWLKKTFPVINLPGFIKVGDFFLGSVTHADMSSRANVLDIAYGRTTVTDARSGFVDSTDTPIGQIKVNDKVN